MNFMSVPLAFESLSLLTHSFPRRTILSVQSKQYKQKNNKQQYNNQITNTSTNKFTIQMQHYIDMYAWMIEILFTP